MKILLIFQFKKLQKQKLDTIIYKNENSFVQTKTCRIEGENKYTVNEYSCVFYIDKYAQSGTYEPYYLIVYDSCGNSRKYLYNSEAYSCLKVPYGFAGICTSYKSAILLKSWFILVSDNSLLKFIIKVEKSAS